MIRLFALALVAMVLSACDLGGELNAQADTLVAGSTAAALRSEALRLETQAASQATLSSQLATALAPTPTATLAPTRTPTNTPTPVPTATSTPTSDVIGTAQAQLQLTQVALNVAAMVRDDAAARTAATATAAAEISIADQRAALSLFWLWVPPALLLVAAALLITICAVALWRWLQVRVTRSGVVETRMLGPIIVHYDSTMPPLVLSPHYQGLLPPAPAGHASPRRADPPPVVFGPDGSVDTIDMQRPDPRTRYASVTNRRNLLNLLIVSMRMHGQGGTRISGFRKINAWLARNAQKGATLPTWSGDRWSTTVACIPQEVIRVNPPPVGDAELIGEYATLHELYLALTSNRLRLLSPTSRPP